MDRAAINARIAEINRLLQTASPEQRAALMSEFQQLRRQLNEQPAMQAEQQNTQAAPPARPKTDTEAFVRLFTRR